MAAGKRMGTGATGGVVEKKATRPVAASLRSMREALLNYVGPDREDNVLGICHGARRRRCHTYGLSTTPRDSIA